MNIKFNPSTRVVPAYKQTHDGRWIAIGVHGSGARWETEPQKNLGDATHALANMLPKPFTL